MTVSKLHRLSSPKTKAKDVKLYTHLQNNISVTDLFQILRNLDFFFSQGLLGHLVSFTSQSYEIFSVECIEKRHTLFTHLEQLLHYPIQIYSLVKILLPCSLELWLSFPGFSKDF